MEKYIKIEQIDVSSLREFGGEGRRNIFKIRPMLLNDLILSIEVLGVLTPLIVRKEQDGYEIIDGVHRWLAAKEAGLKTVPCIVEDIEDNEEIIRLRLILNKPYRKPSMME